MLANAGTSLHGPDQCEALVGSIKDFRLTRVKLPNQA
jgi:hypothetical protein